MATAINAPLNVNFQNGSQLTREIQGSVDRVKFNNLGGEKGFRFLSQALGRLTGQADEFTKSLDAANARVLAFGASVGIVNTVSNAFKALVNSTIEVEKAITEISVVGEKFAGQSKELSRGLFDIAKNTGQAFNEVSKAALEFARQGLPLEQTLARTKDALILTRTTGLDAAKSVEGLSAAVSAFAKAGLSTAQVINKLAAVDQAFKVSSADLIQAFERTGAVAQQAGVSFDELAGIVTALQTETSRGGAVIGNALKTIFSRLQDTSTLTQLQNLGIAVQDLQGNVLPARQILQNLAGDIQGLSKLTQAGIFKDVAGTFQLNQLVSLVNDLGRAQGIAAKATEISSGATNEAYIANEKLNQSLDAILNKLATTGKQFGALLGEIGFSDNLKGILDGINNFIEQVTDVLRGDDLGSKFAKGIVKGIGSVLSGPGFMVFLAIIAKLSLDLAKFGAQSLKTFFGIGKAANDQKQIQESIVQVLLRNRSVLKEIENTQGGQNAQALKFLDILNQQAAAMKDVQGLASNIAGKAYSAGYRQTERGLARRSAGGYLPAQEASDVRRGVGGASPSSKVVSIPNFAFGGGKRGTMIANTSEYIVPNYAGGGSAIFNQDMVKTMGLPAGAKKISAAGGFVPNFAENVSSKYALITNRASDTKLGETFSYKPKGSESAASYQANIYGVNLSKLAGKGGSNLYNRKFSAKALEQRYTSFAVKDAKNFADKVIGQPISPVSIQNLTNAGVIPAVSGTIFETAIQSILTSDELVKKLREGPNALFDFVNTPKINEFFGVPSSVPYLEAKSTASNEARKSFAKKIYQEELKGNPALVSESVSIEDISTYQSLESKKTPAAKALYSKIANQMGLNPLRDRSKINAQMGRIIGKSSFGYIPNFAASALQDAIAREKSAGLSNSQIYIDQNPSLKSPQNPMGLMVANTRDEPFGGIQGISRARKEGMNPKLYGAANGFVPNYAVPSGLSGFAASLNQPANANNSEKVNKGFGEMAGKIFLLQGALSFMSGAVGEATTSFEKFTQQAAKSLGNISSLAIFGKEIRGINIEATGMKGALGKFAKNAGLAGVAIGIAVEGFDFLNFAIKEFSGENEKAALASAKLADASDKLSIKFESLSKTRQTQVSTQAEKILGSAGYEGFFNGIANFFRSEKIGGGDIGANTEVKKGISQLLALGASQTEIEEILRKAKKTKTVLTPAYTVGASYNADAFNQTQTIDITQASDVIAGLEESMTATEGLGKKLSDKFLQFSSRIEDIDFNANEAKGAIKKIRDAIYGQNISPELTATLEEEVKRQEQDFKIKLAKQTLEFEKPINVLKRTLGTIIFESGLAIEKISQQLERESQVIGAITSSKSFATLGDSSRIAFEINSSIDQFQKQYKNQISKFTQETQKSLLEYIPQLGIGTENSKIIEEQVRTVGAATTKQGLQDSIEAFQKQLKNFGVNLDLEKFEELKNKITETESNFDNLNQNLNVQEKILALQNQERILEAQAYDTYRNNLAGFVEQTVKSAKSIAALRGEIERIAITQESNITARTAVSKTGREDVIIRGEEELKAFRDRRDKETAILFEEQAMAAKQQFFTKENIAELNRNTEALNDLRMVLAQDFINKIDDSIRVVEQMANTTGTSLFQGAPTSLSTGITLPSGINNTQDALNYLQNLRGAYSPVAPRLNTGVNLTTAEADLNKITAAIRGGSSFADVQAQINTLSKNEVYVNQLTEYARKMYEAAQTSAATMEENEITLKEQVKANIRNYDIINSYGTKLNNSLKSVRDSLTDPQTRGEFLLKQGVIRRGEKEQSKTSEQEKRNYRSSFGYGFDEAMDKLRARTEDFRNQLGQEIPDLFSQNLAQGLNDAISGAKTLKEALMDAATSFFQEITRKNISNLADLATKGLGSLAQTGLGALEGLFQPNGAKAIPVYASGGFIKGGSGTRDDVPAMLMGGEYVVNKSAVNKYGKGFFDAINGGRMRGYATGGMVDPQTFPTQTGRGGFFTPGDYGQGAITGKNELLTFASQSFTGGQYDYMGGFGMGGATVSLEPESARLSALGREGSPMFERVQQSKDEAFKVYLEGLQKEKEYAELLDQIAKDKKARKKQLQMAIISAVVSSVASYAGSAMSAGAQNATAAAAKTAAASGQTLSTGAKFMAGFKGMFTGTGGQGGLANIFKGTSTQLSDLVIANQNAKMMESLRKTGLFGSGVQGAAKTKGMLNTQDNAVIAKKLAEIYSQVGVGTKGVGKATAYGNANIDPTTKREIEKGIIQNNWQYLGNNGAKLTAGKSIASNVFKTGTVLEINGKEYLVQDTGGMGPNVLDFYSGSNKNMYQNFAGMGQAPFTIKSGGLRSQKALMRVFGGDMNKFLSFYRMFQGRNSGGLVAGGSSISDDVPAMLTGGEFVLNNRATQRIGLQNLNKLNSGAPVSSEGASAEMTQALMSKLDELIQVTENSSQSNVVVNVSSTDQEEQNPADVKERDRELQKKIRQAVLDVIAQEKRLGGSLEKAK